MWSLQSCASSAAGGDTSRGPVNRMLDAGSVAGHMTQESAGPRLKRGKGLCLAAATAEGATMPGLLHAG